MYDKIKNLINEYDVEYMTNQNSENVFYYNIDLLNVFDKVHYVPYIDVLLFISNNSQ